MTKFFILFNIVISMGFSTFGQAWSRLGNGTNALEANGAINSLTSDPLGNIYAAGEFTNDSGYYYVTKWNGSGWSELGSGGNALHATSAIKVIETDKLGNIYAGGSFGFIAKWNGDSWAELGAGNTILNPNDSIFSITSDSSGNIYVAGSLTDDSGYFYVAKWNGSNWSELGIGNNALKANATISTITVDKEGNVYAGGRFTDNTNNAYIAKWDGNTWTNIGTWNDGSGVIDIYYLLVDPLGNFYERADKIVAKKVNNTWIKQGDVSSGVFEFDGGPQICSDTSGNIYRSASPFSQMYNYMVGEWNGEYWNQIGQNYGVENEFDFNGEVSTLITDIYGNVYGAGKFTDATGFTYVAKYTSPPPPVTSIRNLASNIGVKIYPNPSTSNIYLQSARVHPAIEISIINLLGQTIKKIELPENALNNPQVINIESLPKSQYLLRIVGGNVNTCYKFIKS